MAIQKSVARGFVCIALGTYLLTAQQALAQQLEEITVTARKTEESLQDVPISVTAFSAKALQDMGVRDNEDITYMTVNFNNFQQIGRRLDRPVIRGQASPATFGEPNASYFIDGAYVTGSIATLTLGPVERVEILRGPQATQFGRATFSGAVNYVTRRPTDEFTGEATFEKASSDRSTIAGWASGPLIKDKLLFFASAGYEEYGGEWSNSLLEGQAGQAGSFLNPPQQADNSDIGGTRTKQAAGKLLWTVNDTSELTFKVGYNEGDDQHYPQLIVESSELNCYRDGIDADAAPGSPGAFCGVIKPNGRQIRLNIPDLRKGMTAGISANPPPGTIAEDFISSGEDVGLQQDQWNTLLRWDQSINEWDLTLQAAYNKNNEETAYDLDQTQDRPFLGLFSMWSENEREDYSFEGRIASPKDNPFRTSVGVFYFNRDTDFRQKANVGLGQGQKSETRTDSIENIALFGIAEWDFAEKWSASVEARVAQDKIKVDAPVGCDDPASPYFNNGANIKDDEKTSSLVPRFSLRYFPTPDMTLYAQIAKGNKPGGYNLGFFQDGVDGCATLEGLDTGVPIPGSEDPITGEPIRAQSFVGEEKSWNYEVGAKSSWFDNRLQANLSVYYIDWDNQAVFETVPIPREALLPAPQSIALNAGKSEVYGLEFESILAITDNLTGSLAYGLTHAEFEEYQNPALEALTGDADASGLTIANSPKHSIVSSLSYQRPVTAQLDWFARTDFTFESKRYASTTNTDEIDYRKRWNARTGVDTGMWRITVFVDNILDEQTPSAILGFPRLSEPGLPQGYALTPTPGRSAGAQAIWRFGN